MDSDRAMHEGHRQRMRERIANNGLGTLEAHEVLEYLLYPFIPRKDTNVIAHRLMNEFGSFYAVLNSDTAHLAAVEGMTQNAALFLSTLPEAFRIYISGMESPKISLKGRGEARRFMGNKFFGAPEENVCVAALDAHDNLIACNQLAKGTGDTVDLSVRQVVDYALKNRASGILLAHNHPSGNVLPSQSDVEMTFRVMTTLQNIGIKLLDHFIFCGSEYYSFEEEGKLEKLLKMKSVFKEGIYIYD